MDKDKKELEKTRLKKKKTAWWNPLWCSVENRICNRTLLLGAISLAIAFLVTPSFTVSSNQYQLGEIADQNIKAVKDLLIEDEPATQKKREEAASHSPMVYDLDLRVADQSIERLRSVFQAMRNHRGEREVPFPQKESTFLGAYSYAELQRLSNMNLPGASPAAPPDKSDFETLVGFSVPADVFQNLKEEGFSKAMENKLASLLRDAYEEGILVNKASLMQAQGESLVLRDTATGRERISTPPHAFPDMEEARRLVKMEALNRGESVREMMTLSFLASQLLRPNLSFNLEETELRRERAYTEVRPTYIQVKQNEMLVREGQRVGPAELLKLNANFQKTSIEKQVLAFFTMFFFAAICLWVTHRVAHHHIPNLRLDYQDLLFLGILMAFLLLLGRSSMAFAGMIAENNLLLTDRAVIYAIPFSAGAMLACIFFGVTIALIFSLLLTLFAGLLFGKDFGLFLYFLIGSFVAAHAVSPCRNRMIPIRAGALVGCASVLLIVLHTALTDQFIWSQVFLSAMLGFSGGLFAGILVTGLTPLAEMIFGYNTDIKLLELATMDQPLMQELMVQAPGTYHHSIIVGNMVEAAAKSIGANSLLAKVAAYYHDIGKIKKPLYFIENQFDCENRHEKLAPSMSSLILISHVKEGVELAKQHRLGRDIVDIISQHHGKSFISFFYKKALEARERTKNTKGLDPPPINMDDYRYPGPKPQTREAGLVMLADVVEAACRSLTDPTPARIQGMVNRLINNIFSDGQLDECELTLKDLHHIAKHFNQILSTIHHKRIEYPSGASNDAKGKGDVPDSNHREPKADKDKPGALRKDGKTDLKRLGIH